MMQPYFFLIRYRWSLCIASLVMMTFLAVGLSRLGFNSSWRIFFSIDNPYLLSYDSLTDKFPHHDNLIFITELKRGNFYTPQNIQTLQQLTEKAGRLPYAFQVSSLGNYYFIEQDEDGIRVEELISSDFPLTPDSLTLLREKVLTDELLVNRLINVAGTLTMVIVDLSARFQRGDQLAMDEVIQGGRAIQEEIRHQNPDLKIYLFGSVIHDFSAVKAAGDDFKRLFPIIVLFALVISYIIGRSLGTMMAILLVLLGAVMATFGLAGWLGYKLNVVSSQASLLVAILALADTVHLGTTYLKELIPGRAQKKAIYISLKKNLMAIFLTSLTTVAGLYSLNFVGSAAFADMANIAIHGVVIAFIFSITIFPAILLLFTRNTVNKGISQQRLAEVIAHFSIRYRKPLFLFFWMRENSLTWKTVPNNGSISISRILPSMGLVLISCSPAPATWSWRR